MDIILHHYDESSFSEKVRLMLGWKRLAWHSVEIPSHGPKPEYTPLTAGYRRTPALQVGADVYCDTRLIAEELERRVPEPSLFPACEDVRARALSEVLTSWAEQQLFRPLAVAVTGEHAARFPAAFHADRAALHGKPRPDLARVMAAARHHRPQFEAQLRWLEDLLADGQAFVLGARALRRRFRHLCRAVVPGNGRWPQRSVGRSAPDARLDGARGRYRSRTSARHARRRCLVGGRRLRTFAVHGQRRVHGDGICAR